MFLSHSVIHFEPGMEKLIFSVEWFDSEICVWGGELQHCFKQRVWISGARPGEEEVFEFTLIQVKVVPY
jgi:hypothetical protein